jgi:hypothetical protein
MHHPGAAGSLRRHTMRSVAITLAAVAPFAAAAAAFATRPATHATIVAALNAERAANGIPATVRENPAWSARCADHVAYMTETGGLTHREDPESPGYTPSGSWAGEHAVLAVGSGWGDSDPFENAPLHLMQLMSPELQQVGIAENASGYLCVTTWPGYNGGKWTKPTVFTYPGNGTEGVPAAQTARELPFVPGDFVGLPLGTRTGLNIMVFAEGIAHPWRAHIASATLAGPAGPVAVKTVDRTTPTVGVYLPPGGGFVIPVAPLRPDTTYSATVRFAGAPRYAWQFTTAGA